MSKRARRSAPAPAPAPAHKFTPGPAIKIPIPNRVTVAPPPGQKPRYFWSVDRRIFELTNARVQTNQLLFERPATTVQSNHLGDFLADAEDCLLNICGPPGVGKSVQTLTRLLQEFTVHRNPMLMVLLPSQHIITTPLKAHVFSYDDGVNVNKSSFNFLLSEIVVACTANNCDLVLIDNLTQINAGIANLCGIRLSKTVVVSSLPVTLQDSPWFDTCNVDGWRLQEYIAACSYQPFYQLVFAKFDGATAADDDQTRERLLSDKYSMAGHSARNMFGYTSSRLYTQLLDVVEHVSVDFPAQMGDSTSTAVNSALSRMNDVPVLVSTTIARLLGSRFTDTLISASMQLLAIRSNPDTDEVVFETDFFVHLGRDLTNVQHPIVTVPRAVDLGPVVQFRSGLPNEVCKYLNPTQTNTGHRDVFAQISPANLGDVHWFVPLIVNNAGFDFVQWERTALPAVAGGPTVGILRFIQATRALTHTFHKNHYDMFYNMFVTRYANLNITCEVYFVVPDSIVNQFTVGLTDGALTGFQDGTERIVGFRRIQG